MKRRFTATIKFKRRPPAVLDETIPLPLGWVVLPFRAMPIKSDRRKYHGKWIKIKSDDATIYRVLRFSANIKGKIAGDGAMDILLDWAGWLDLCGRVEDEIQELTLTISNTNIFERIYAGLTHPEPTIKISMKLAIISVALGLTSILMAIPGSVWKCITCNFNHLISSVLRLLNIE